MSGCTPPDFSTIYMDLLAAGKNPEQAYSIIKTIASVSFDDNTRDAADLFLADKSNHRVLTKEEETELATLGQEASSKFSDEAISKVAHNSSFMDVFQSLLGPDKANRFFDLLMASGMNLRGTRFSSSSNLIDQLVELKKAHEQLGNTSIVEDLQEAIEAETVKQERRQENQDNRKENIHNLTARDTLLSNLVEIFQMVDTHRIPPALLAINAEAGEERKKFENLVRDIKEYVGMRDHLWQIVKAEGLDGGLFGKLSPLYFESDARKNYDKHVAKGHEQFVKNKKESKKALKRVRALLLQIELKDFKDRTGKDVSVGDIESMHLLDRLTREQAKLQDKLIELNLLGLSSDVRGATVTVESMLVNQERSARVIASGVEIKMNAIEEQYSSLDKDGKSILSVDIAIAEEFFGKSALDVVLNNREKIKISTGEFVPDLSPLSREEVKVALSVWKSKMKASFDGTFFSEDPALITEEVLLTVEAIASGRGFVDGSSPDAMDPIFGPERSQIECLLTATPGDTPEKNKAKSFSEAARLYESTIRRLNSVFNFTGFNGFISEKIIRQVLHQRLLDISPAAYASARVDYSAPRTISSINAEDRINFRYGIIKAHGGDPSIMPEFNDPNWHSNNDKLISFDIETFGDINHDTDKIDSVMVIQLHTRDSITGLARTELLVNHNGVLVDAKTVPAKQRQALTPEQVSSVMQRLEDAQNAGYKVLTHNGNGFDFAFLGKHVKDNNQLARVALRSIDLLANVTSNTPGTSWKTKGFVPGRSLKTLVGDNLPPRNVDILAYDGRVKFVQGYPIDMATGAPITLHKTKGLVPLWEEAEATGDWYKIDAYSENDADLTIALHLHLSNPETDSLSLLNEEIGKAITITSSAPLSNLMLNNTSGHNPSKPADSLGALKIHFPEIAKISHDLSYTIELGYDANKFYTILNSWWLTALMNDPTGNRAKINSVVSGLRTRAGKETDVDSHLADIAFDMEQGVKPILLEKFKQFGFIISLNYSYSELFNTIVEINDPMNGTLPTGRFREEENEENLYSNSTKDPKQYTKEILTAFYEFIKDPEVSPRFKRAVQDRLSHIKRNDGENETAYWERAINQYLSELIPEFTSLAQFGNGELDWKPANEVGIAIAQVMMNQKPGIISVDKLTSDGKAIEVILASDAQDMLITGRHMNKKYGMPERRNVNMSQPHELSKEELAYDGFRLLERVKHYLDMKIDSSNKVALETWLTVPLDQEIDDPISFFVSEQVLAVSPDINVRSPFAKVLDLKNKRKITMEHLHDIPRLLVSFNHDCMYYGIMAPPRLISDEYPVFFVSDLAHPGGPTAACLIGGGLDQLAWMTQFNMMSPKELKQLDSMLQRGLDLNAKHGSDIMDISNKADYAYSGKHIILVMMQCYREGNTRLIDDLLVAMGVQDENGKPAGADSKKFFVNKKQLPDPRYLCADLLMGKTDDVNDRGILHKISENPGEFDMSEEDSEHAASILKKIGGKDRLEAKELLKGAITPAFYQAGYDGILAGLLDKNEDRAEPFTIEELEFLAQVLTNAKLHAQGKIIEIAIGFTSADGKKTDWATDLKKLLLTRIQKANTGLNGREARYASELSSKNQEDKTKAKAQRFSSMSQWAKVSASNMSEDELRANGILPGTASYNTEKTKLEASIVAGFKDRIEAASSFWGDKDVSKMTTKEYHDWLYEMNVIVAGGTDKANEHLALYALNRRASTPFVMQGDVADLQRFTTGVHIDSEDFVRFLEKEIYFRYGINTANGRNHMTAWFGLGPESSKFAQPKVVHGGKGDINPYGLWDIKELSKTLEETDTLFTRQMYLNLARFYKPPTVTGYDASKTESREAYFRELDRRSKLELVAMELARKREQANGDDVYSFPQGDFTVEQTNQRNKKNGTSVAERLRLRTLAPVNPAMGSSRTLNPRVAGLGALRPTYADIDFSQRGIYALARAQHTQRRRENKFNRVLSEAAASVGNISNPDAIPGMQNRGYVSAFGGSNTPAIPMSSDDIGGMLALGEDAFIESRAIRMRTELEVFARMSGLDSLLESKDWPRLYIIKRIHDKALLPAIKTLQRVKPSGSVEERYAAQKALVDARVKFINGIIRAVGISAGSLSGKQSYSVIQMMAGFKESGVTREDLDEIKKQYPDGLGYIQLLTYLAGKGDIDRLQGMNFKLTLEPGDIIRGRRGRGGVAETVTIAVTTHNKEVIHLYHYIMASETASRVATKLLETPEYEKLANSPSLVRDGNGFVIVASIDPRINKSLYEAIWRETVKERKAVTLELMKRFEFSIDRQSTLRINDNNFKGLRENKSGDVLSQQGDTDQNPFVFTEVDNIGTLWAFTGPMVEQMLNAISNHPLFSTVELAYQTDKSMNVEKTRLDEVLDEQGADLFDRLRENEDDVSKALLFLHRLDPGNVKPDTLMDPRHKDKHGNPLEIIDFGKYLRVFEFRKKKGKRIKLSDGANDVNMVVNGQVISFPTADIPFVTTITSVISKAQASGFLKEAEQIGNFLILAAKQEESIPKERNLTSNYKVKLLAVFYEVFGNTVAEDNAFRFVGIMNIDQVPGLSAEIREIAEVMHHTQHTAHHTKEREFYVAHAILERMGDIPVGASTDSTLIDTVASMSGTVPSVRTQININMAMKDLSSNTVEPEIALPMFAMSASPDVYVNPDNFTTSFAANAKSLATARKFVDSLRSLVKMGVISQRVMDMKLMLVGSLCRTNPEFITELGLEHNTGENGQSLMNAKSESGRYTIGLNITAMRAAPENEILYHFAEELVHVARMKFIKTNSAEWNRVTGLYSTNRARGAIKEVLIAMNQGKPYDLLDKEVDYAMSNTDEWFAHMGAFFLLRDVLGNQTALNAMEAKVSLFELEAKHDVVTQGISLWRKAFHRTKSFAKIMLQTFAKLKTSPEYSDFFGQAEIAVSSLIGKGMAGRADVQNDDESFNAYSAPSVTKGNKKVPSPTDIQSIKTLNNTRRELEIKRTVELNRSRDKLTLDNINEELELNVAEIRALDATTVTGISVSQVVDTIEDLTILGRTRTLTMSDLDSDVKKKAVISHLVMNALERRGTRLDTPFTLASTARSTVWTIGTIVRATTLRSTFIEQFIQNGVLAGLNASALTYNSPLALAMALSQLVDSIAVTTVGSISGIATGTENDKLQLDPYPAYVSERWASLCDKYKDNRKKQMELCSAVVSEVHLIDTSKILSKEDHVVVLEIAKAMQNFATRITNLDIRTGGRDATRKYDKFPIRVARMSNFSAEQQDIAFTTINEAIKEKHLADIRTIGKDPMEARFSNTLLFIGDILPYYPEGSSLDSNDRNFINLLASTNGTVGAVTARHVMLKFFLQKAVQTYLEENPTVHTVKSFYGTIAVGGGSNTTADSFNTGIQKEIRKYLAKNRGNTESFHSPDAFQKLSTREMNILTAAYIDVVETKTSDIQAKSLFDNSLNSSNKSNSARQDFGFGLAPLNPKPLDNQFFVPSHALTYEFLSKCGVSTHLFPEESFLLNSEDIFLSKNPKLQNLFDNGIDSIANSLATGQGYDMLEKVNIQDTLEIPGAFFTFSQILNLIEEQLVEGQSSSVERYHVMNQLGVLLNHDQTARFTKSSIDRFRLAQRVIRRYNVTNDTDLGEAYQWVNSALKTAVLLKWGPNIGMATFIVEGVIGGFYSISQGTNYNPLLMFQNLWFTMAGFSKEWMKGWGRNLHDTFLPEIKRTDGTGMLPAGIPFPKLGTIRHMSSSELMSNCIPALEEMSSTWLPQNFMSGTGSSETLDTLSYWDRMMFRKARTFSNVGRAIRITTDAAANRILSRNITNDKLAKVRSLWNAQGNPKMETISQIENLFKDAGIRTDREVILALWRSGIVNGSRIEALEFVISEYGTYRSGVILLKNIMELEGKLNRGDIDITHPFLTKYGMTPSDMINALVEARTSILFTQEAISGMSQATKRGLDVNRTDNVVLNMLGFFKSYPVLFMAQHLMRRGSIASGPKMALYLGFATILDLSYSIVAALCRGAMSYEELLEKITRRDKKAYGDLARLILRNPVFMSNPLGAVANMTASALVGTTGSTISSVGEAAILDMFKDAIKLYPAMINAGKGTKMDLVMYFYKNFGFLFPDVLNTLGAHAITDLLHQSYKIKRATQDQDAFIEEEKRIKDLQEENKELNTKHKYPALSLGMTYTPEMEFIDLLFGGLKEEQAQAPAKAPAQASVPAQAQAQAPAQAQAQAPAQAQAQAPAQSPSGSTKAPSFNSFGPLKPPVGLA